MHKTNVDIIIASNLFLMQLDIYSVSDHLVICIFNKLLARYLYDISDDV